MMTKKAPKPTKPAKPAKRANAAKQVAPAKKSQPVKPPAKVYVTWSRCDYPDCPSMIRHRSAIALISPTAK
jgi:hypothetical protein